MHVYECAYVWHESRVMRQDGQTALMKATTNGHTDIVQQLLDRGADVNHADKVKCELVCTLVLGVVCLSTVW